MTDSRKRGPAGAASSVWMGIAAAVAVVMNWFLRAVVVTFAGMDVAIPAADPAQAGPVLGVGSVNAAAFDPQFSRDSNPITCGFGSSYPTTFG